MNAGRKLLLVVVSLVAAAAALTAYLYRHGAQASGEPGKVFKYRITESTKPGVESFGYTFATDGGDWRTIDLSPEGEIVDEYGFSASRGGLTRTKDGVKQIAPLQAGMPVHKGFTAAQLEQSPSFAGHSELAGGIRGYIWRNMGPEGLPADEVHFAPGYIPPLKRVYYDAQGKPWKTYELVSIEVRGIDRRKELMDKHFDKPVVGKVGDRK